MRDKILPDCVKEFPCIYDKKGKSHKVLTFLGNAWQKVKEKLKNSDFDIEVEEAKTGSANLKKRYQRKRAALIRAKKSGHGS